MPRPSLPKRTKPEEGEALTASSSRVVRFPTSVENADDSLSGFYAFRLGTGKLNLSPGGLSTLGPINTIFTLLIGNASPEGAESYLEPTDFECGIAICCDD